jgi:hypothetical protein
LILIQLFQAIKNAGGWRQKPGAQGLSHFTPPRPRCFDRFGACPSFLLCSLLASVALGNKASNIREAHWLPMRAIDAVAIVKIERGMCQIPGGHAARDRVLTPDRVMSDRQSGLHLDETAATVLFNPRVATPVAHQLDSGFVFLASGDHLINAIVVVHAWPD